MTRIQGWESRLIAVIDAARHVPYVLGVHDCFRLACAVVEALTGVDRWPDFAGTYATKREALVRIAEHGSSFEDAGSWFFGGAPININFAQRGDIAALMEKGMYHLGIVMGEKIVCLSDDGVIDRPRECACVVWGVGRA